MTDTAKAEGDDIHSFPASTTTLPASLSLQTVPTMRSDATGLDEAESQPEPSPHSYPPSAASSGRSRSERPLAPLPQADHGREAYLFLFAAFTVGKTSSLWTLRVGDVHVVPFDPR